MHGQSAPGCAGTATGNRGLGAVPEKRLEPACSASGGLPPPTEREAPHRRFPRGRNRNNSNRRKRSPVSPTDTNRLVEGFHRVVTVQCPSLRCMTVARALAWLRHVRLSLPPLPEAGKWDKEVGTPFRKNPSVQAFPSVHLDATVAPRCRLLSVLTRAGRRYWGPIGVYQRSAVWIGGWHADG